MHPPYQWNNILGLTISAASSLVRLAYDNETKPSFIAPITYDYACPLILAPGGPDMEALKKISNITELGGGSEIGY